MLEGLPKPIQQGIKQSFEKAQKRFIVEVECSEAGAKTLAGILDAIAAKGNIGHSYSIILDPDDVENKEVLGWDGDGSDQIKDIKINGISYARSKKG